MEESSQGKMAFVGTLTSGSASVTGVNSTTGLIVGGRRHRGRYAVQDDDPGHQQFDCHDHALGERDGERLPEPYRDCR